MDIKDIKGFIVVEFTQETLDNSLNEATDKYKKHILDVIEQGVIVKLFYNENHSDIINIYVDEKGNPKKEGYDVHRQGRMVKIWKDKKGFNR